MLCTNPSGLQELEEPVDTGTALSVMSTQVVVVSEACAEVFASFIVHKYHWG